MLPAYLPNPVAALCGGGLPVDLGRTFTDGKRLLGDGKTWRGLVAGIIAGILIGILQIWLQGQPGWTILPQQTLLTITLLSIGALLGDMVKSFFKRRLGKARGAKWPIADMYDLVIGSLVLLLVFDPAWLITYVTLPVLIVILVLTPALHRAMNILGYMMKVKEVPW